jgi:hypothetical protein
MCGSRRAHAATETRVLCVWARGAQWDKTHPSSVAIKLMLLKAGAPCDDNVTQMACYFRSMDALFEADNMVRPARSLHT